MKIIFADNTQVDIDVLEIVVATIRKTSDGQQSWMPIEMSTKNNGNSQIVTKQIQTQMVNINNPAKYKFKCIYGNYEFVGCYISDVIYEEDYIKFKLVYDNKIPII